MSLLDSERAVRASDMGTGRVLRSCAINETGTLGDEVEELEEDWNKRDEV